MDIPNEPMPEARQDALLIHELPEESLVYDLRRHRAYCLNRTAALVWRRCDGHTTVADMARWLQDELAVPVDEALVWYALQRLHKAHLLREQPISPTGTARYSRRELVRRMGTLSLVGGLAAFLPLITTIVAPVAAATISCIATASCDALGTGSTCPGLQCCENRSLTCIKKLGHCQCA